MSRRAATQPIELTPDMESIGLLMNDHEFLKTDRQPIDEAVPNLGLYTYEPTDGEPTFTAADFVFMDTSLECMMDSDADDEETDDWCK